MIPDNLVRAYREALYRIETGAIGNCVCPGFDLQVDRPSPELSKLLNCVGQCCAALITADNPRSERHDPSHNDPARARLRAAIRALALPSLDTWGLDPDDRWPPEQGLLVPGLDLEPAKWLGIDFGQSAILWADSDARPQLILLR